MTELKELEHVRMGLWKEFKGRGRDHWGGDVDDGDFAVISHHLWQSEIDLSTAGEKGDRPDREEDEADVDEVIASWGRTTQAANPTRADAIAE